MQAVPIHASAPIQITIRAGAATNSPASMAHVGSHHANTLVRTLPSQSAAGFAVTFVMTNYPAQQLVRAPLVRDSGIGGHGTSSEEQNTQQSPDFWLELRVADVAFIEKLARAVRIVSALAVPQFGQVIMDRRIIAFLSIEC
jgi:hypothetical protein